MNSSLKTYIINNWDMIMWLLFYSIGTIFLYKIDIKDNWQKLRVKNGLVNEEEKNPPYFLDKCPFENRIYLCICICLFLYTMFFSLLIISIYYLQFPKRDFKDISQLISTFVSLLVLYFLFIGAPIDKDKIISKETSLIYNRLVSIITYIKSYAIESAISKEQEFLKRSLKEMIKGWKKSNGLYVGVLILRIGTDFLNKKLPKDTPDEIKDKLCDATLNLIKVYDENKFMLVDEVFHLFKDFIQYGIKLYDIIEFVKIVELVAEDMDEEDVKKQIEHLRYIKTPPAKMSSVNRLKEMIGSILDGITVDSIEK